MKNCEKDSPIRGKGTEARKMATIPLGTQAIQDCQRKDAVWCQGKDGLGFRGGAVGAVHPGPGRKGLHCVSGVLNQ